MRIGFGYDIHALEPLDIEHASVKGTFVLGGIVLPSSYRIKAHSDGDVVLHALMDALLGALALGDIGQHFPDTDDRYKGISSVQLLEKVYQLLVEKGYVLGNADLTIIAEVPKLSPYYTAMREKIADILSCDTDRISVKATTAEGLGALGRTEGLAVHAVVLLNLL
jgi:2-C-methyl-D-erythritol 2,4-cyclodiphosphate synthase